MSTNQKKSKTLLTVIVIGVIVIVASVLILIILGTQKKPAEGEYDLSANQVVTRVIKKMNYNNLTPISKENITRYFVIPKEAVTDYAMYISGKSGTDIELSCFILKKKDFQEDMISSINDYINEKNLTSQTSAQGCTSNVTIHYPYIFVAVAQDSETASSSFETVLSDRLRELEQQ